MKSQGEPDISEFSVEHTDINHRAKSSTYRISSYKTRKYYFFIRLSTAGIIRTRLLIEDWYYNQNFINMQILKALLSKSRVFAWHAEEKYKN